MTMNNATTVETSAPAQRSWAQIVQGSDETSTKTQKPIVPAARGSLLRCCRGEVLSMITNYGWLMVYGNVDDPASEKHEGDIYIHKDDVVDGNSLFPGDIVTFYLYVDDQGLGAEMCSVEERGAANWADVNEIAKVFSRLSNIFASLDVEDEAQDIDFMYEGMETTKLSKFNCALSSDGSTSEGTTSEVEDNSSLGVDSDSEDDRSSMVVPVATTTKAAALPLQIFCPPPGLSLTEDDDDSGQVLV